MPYLGSPLLCRCTRRFWQRQHASPPAQAASRPVAAAGHRQPAPPGARAPAPHHARPLPPARPADATPGVRARRHRRLLRRGREGDLQGQRGRLLGASKQPWHRRALETRPRIIFAPYGDHWRQLRRILMTELLSARRVEAFRRIREEEAARLVSTVHASGGGLVDVNELLDVFVTDSAVRAIFGDRLPERAAFLKMVKQGVRLSSLLDLRDLFPSSRLVRLLPRSGGKAERHRREMFRLMDNILKSHEERRRVAGDGEDEQDMVDVLLRTQKDEAGAMRVSLTDGVIRAVLIDIFGAALDTTITLLQWAMAELMANPRVMQRVQSETRCVLAQQATIQESVLKDMHYLKAVIKETFRLHPPAPLIPRVCLRDCKINGYGFPQGVTILTNVWAISRDPKYWNEPEKFNPERFKGDDDVDFRGLDFEFTPFGVGRRICPGISFAHAGIVIALASLLYHFDWDLPTGVRPTNIDMTEVFGFTLRRKANLFLHPIPHVPL